VAHVHSPIIQVKVVSLSHVSWTQSASSIHLSAHVNAETKTAITWVVETGYMVDFGCYILATAVRNCQTLVHTFIGIWL